MRIKNNIYYLYSNRDNKYVCKTPEEMKQFIDSIDKHSFQIIGTFNRFNPQETAALEL